MKWKRYCVFFKNIDGNTDTCVVTIGADEVCDDGANNGHYKSSGAPSYCKNDCSGLIQNGTEYFCGDGVVQYKPGDQCYDTNCTYAIPANYPGAIITDFTASEECDSSNNNNTKHLCDIYLKKQGKATASSYYNSGSISCSACKISASNNPCGYCGDGVYQSGKETCENTAAGIQYSGGTYNKKSSTVTYSATDSTTSYTIPYSGLYEIKLHGGSGGNGGHGYAGSSNSNSGGNGGSGAGGAVVTARYYLDKDTTLDFVLGKSGGNGTGGTGAQRNGGSPGGSAGTGYQDGEAGETGYKGTEYSGLIVHEYGGGGGAGGGSGGSSAVKIGETVLMTAQSGGGGGGGGGGGATSGSGSKGGDASGKTRGEGGDGGGSWGGDGDHGGTGVGSNSVTSGSGAGWKYKNKDTDSTASGQGSITVTLVKYAPCIKVNNECKFETNTANFVDVNTSTVPCTGLIANAEWWNSSVNQTPSGSGWTPPSDISSASSSYWRETNPNTNGCYFHCSSGYNWNGSACVNTRVVECPLAGRPTENPEDGNWEWNTVDQIVQNWTGSTWDPADTVSYSDDTPTTTACRFKCKYGYTYDGGQCKNTKTVNCTGLPAHAHWTSNNSTSKTITQNWTPANNWQPSSTGSNNSSTTANQCYFQCNKNYNYNSATNTCVAKTQTVSCTNLPAANAVWWSSGSTTTPQITQTWDENGSGCNGTNCWYPTNVGSNQASGASNHCYFHCKTNYTYSASGNTCEANTQPADCSSKPGNTSWNDSGYNHKNVAGTFTQTWDGSDWTPESYTSTHSTTAGICKFKCNTNYTWNSTTSQCDADHQPGTCGAIPSENTVWNDGGGYQGSGKFEQIWNGSAWNPASKAAVYSPNSTQECGYKCADGFHTENGGLTCISNTRTTASCSAKPDHSVWNDGGNNGKFTQTWNGSWTPASFTSTYNETAGECRFKCDTNFEWKDSQCKPKQISGQTCTGNPANSTIWLPQKITQTWTYVNDTWQWYPSTTATYTFIPVSGECHFRCDDGYGWSGSACIPECSTSSGTPCIDSSTGLIWSSLQDKKAWADLPSSCSNLGEGGYSWKAPTIDELRTLIVGCDTTSGSGGACKLSDPSCLCYSDGSCTVTPKCSYNSTNCSCSSGSSKLGDTVTMWSSSKQIYNDSTTYAWGVKFDNKGSILDGTRTNQYNFRCVARSSAGAVNAAIVYLKLDEGGTASATVNSGTLGGTYPVSGGSWDASGKHGKAYNFTGNTIIGSAGTFNSSAYYNNFTVMAWVKPNSSISMPSSTSGSGVFTVTSNAERYIFGASHGGEPAENPAGAGVAVGTNGIFVTAHGGGYLPALAYYSTSLSSSQWYHVAVVFENKVPKIYLNGNHVATGATPTKNIFPPSQIGGGSYGNFSGSLDDVIIIGSALTAAEIQAEYNR